MIYAIYFSCRDIEYDITWLYNMQFSGDCTYIVARVNNIYIEESILLPYTPVEERSVKL